MQELDKRIGMLRIMLADIEGKRAQLADMEKQYHAQLSRIVEFVVYREGDVGNALSLMSEVQLKLDEVTETSKHLDMIATKANSELEALVLTKRVAEARSQLSKLEERQRELAARLSHLSDEPAEADTIISEDERRMEDIRAIYDEVESEIARASQPYHRRQRTSRAHRTGKGEGVDSGYPL